MPPRRKNTSTSPSSVASSGPIVVVRLSVPCGWCITNQCSDCLPEMLFERKLYMCGCKKCCNGHTPTMGEETERGPSELPSEGDSVKDSDGDGD